MVERDIHSLDIQHHFTGGIAASLYGEPRFTQDIDVVLALSPASEKIARQNLD